MRRSLFSSDALFRRLLGGGARRLVYILAGVEETIDALEDFRPKVATMHTGDPERSEQSSLPGDVEYF